jgi:CO dehydrogenase/acetyl-CoA synthase delta subunit
MGQRDIVWTRISKDGFKKGLRLKHYGEILHAKLLSEYPAIVDKVKITLITDEAEVEKRVSTARKVYDERNRRLEAMTDDSVDIFYSCLLCQSFAPDHVCIITPERLGLCGAYNWLDGKAAYEIDETGPNQPVQKGECLDPVKGVWKGVNDYIYPNSHKSIESFSAYSIMNNPMTSCGCFEVICAYVPECNGVMAVNREFQGDTPSGMSFSTLAGSVGGGQQTPGFMGCGKVFLTSRKFLFAEGGFKRLVWMPKELKELLKRDLKKRGEEQDYPEIIDYIADETIATDADAVRQFMEKINHPALEMEDMTTVSADSEVVKSEKEDKNSDSAAEVVVEKSDDSGNEELAEKLDSSTVAELKEQLKSELLEEMKKGIREEVVKDIINSLSTTFLGVSTEAGTLNASVEVSAAESVQESVKPSVSPKEKLDMVKSFNIPKDATEIPVWKVKLGASAGDGGTRKVIHEIGGASCMPFHTWEGEMPNRPLVAMEVFDKVSEKYPAVLRDIYGDLLEKPADMARVLVDKYGADLISVRLEGTHPEKGNRSAEESVSLVKDVLEAVEVPVIVTGHNNFDKNNEVMKAVAQACNGENLLLNYVEQDNYRTIAGAAMAYGHSIVAQSPIDVNIAKQMNILLTNMDLKKEQIVMDPMTGAAGYGIEYTYSVMERIRLTGINGDKMLAGPMIVSTGQECAKIKEFKALESDFPEWGDLKKRALLWELTTAVNLLYAGADILIMYHPEAAMQAKKTILKLMA